MKFSLTTVILAAAAHVSAQTEAAPPTSEAAVPTAGPSSGSSCEAEYILTRCLETEQPKAAACDPTDYGCQCAAYEAIATCYNNCPDDARSVPAQNQVLVFCNQADVDSSRSDAAESTAEFPAESTTEEGLPESTTDLFDVTSSETEETAPSTTAAGEQNRVSNTATPSDDSDESDDTGAAPEMMRNTGGMLLGVAGVMAIIL